MRLEYNALWFENDYGWLKPTSANLFSFLEDFGFTFIAKIEKDNENVRQILEDIKNNLLDIDIIFMDYKLAKEKKGDTIIQEIRKTELFTEIIFYSYKTNVKKVIEESVDEAGKKIGSVEGIYYAERDIFLEKAKTVIRHSIKKVQEVNSMRGLIMSAVSDIDGKMLDIIETSINLNDDIGKEISKYVFEVCKEFIDQKTENFDNYQKENRAFELIHDTLIFDSYKKARVVQKIIKLLNHPELDHLKKFCDEFNSDVIQPRNAFGHVVPTVKDGKKVLIPKRGKEIVFNDDECIRIRKLLHQHAANIDLIKSKINRDETC